MTDRLLTMLMFLIYCKKYSLNQGKILLGILLRSALIDKGNLWLFNCIFIYVLWWIVFKEFLKRGKFNIIINILNILLLITR